ncbi:MAG TPA: efflux RND transporter periplasmic adaptor subunit [Gemmatimonadales bacterium]|nr:efflux RND transporter periplasmic adaptor subunit [Gemmatimonadales bacterium]
MSQQLEGRQPGVRFAALAAVILVLAAGCRGGGAGRGGFPPAEVAVVAVAPHTVAQSFEFPGEVQPYRRVEVRARVEGIIEQRPFTEGAMVKPGELLYRLDKVRYDAAFRSAQARLQNARQTFERVEPLLAQRAVAQQDVDNARAELAAAQGAFDQAKKDLDDTDVRAEIEGRVGRTLMEVGARVTGPADLLTTIDRLDPVYVTFEPSSQQLLEWRENARWRDLILPGSRLTVQVVLPDGTVLPRTGRLDFVAPSLDAATGTQEFRATFQNADRLLMPGQFVRVRLVGFARDSAIAVPQRAVQTGLGRQFVYVVGAGDTVQTRDVQTGAWAGDQWIINRGLAPGDRVVVDGIQKVVPGRPVKPVPLADSAAAAGTPVPAGKRPGAGAGR